MQIDPNAIKWDSAPAAAPTAPRGDPIIAPAPPSERRADVQTDLSIRSADRQDRVENRQSQAASLSNELAQLKIDEEKRRLQEEAEGKETSANADILARDKLVGLIRKMNRIGVDASDNDGWFETGTSGSIARTVLPQGTAGNDLAAQIETIRANFAFDALQAMRDASKTGGALGQVSEKELALLQAAVQNIDPNQSHDQFMSNLVDARDGYLARLEMIDKDAARDVQLEQGPWRIGGTDGKIGIYSDRRNRDKAAAVNPETPTEPPTGGGYGDALAAGFGDIAEGFGDILGIVGNPLNATINAVAGTDLSTDLGGTARGDLPKGNETIGAINQAATAALSGSLGARAATALANPGVARNALEVVGRTPFRDMAAGGGAGAGGAAGKASGIPGGEVAGTLIGGIGGYGGASALANAGRSTPNALSQAAARQNVDLLPADTGGTVSGMVTSGAKASPISASPIRDAAQRGQKQLRTAVNRISGDAGEALETDEAGSIVATAADRFRKTTSARASRLYDRAGELAKGVKPKPIKALEVLDDNITRLSEMPETNGPVLQSLKKLRSDLDGGVSVSGLRDARSSLSQGVYDGKLRSSQEQGMMREVLGALSEDIEVGLRSVGRDDAANAFKRADTFWKGRVEHIDEVLQPILGKGKSGEEVMAALDGMTRGQRGGNARLSRLLKEMGPSEAGNIRATIVSRIGRSNSGAQNAEGTAFSAATFLTNWNKMTPQAKASLFSDSKMRSNLNDIAKLAEGMKTGQAMSNHSNTALSIGSNVGGGIALGVANPALTGLAVAGQYATGRLMSNPAFARWLAKAPKGAAAQRKWTEDLGIIGAREPLIASDAKSLQDALTRQFQQSPTAQLSAEEENQDIRREPIS